MLKTHKFGFIGDFTNPGALKSRELFRGKRKEWIMLGIQKTGVNITESRSIRSLVRPAT